MVIVMNNQTKQNSIRAWDAKKQKKQEKFKNKINLEWFKDEYIKIINMPDTDINPNTTIQRYDFIRNCKYNWHI